MRSTFYRLLAIFIPGICFLLQHHYRAAIICLVLQLSLIGWVPASVWALMSTKDDTTQKKVEKYLKNVRQYNNQKTPVNNSEVI
jgi:uncharacterized membrane protein YqaE (UPF0057 family)